jgi:Asp-tRNA(Asn)/Glu-tRNA(Gln) amidotransferase A subunit family amidase
MAYRSNAALSWAAPVTPSDRANTPANLTATEFLALLHRSEISVLDYVSACADRVTQLEPALRAWAYYDRDQFLASARTIDDAVVAARKADAPLPGRMTGVPVGVKDIFNTSDMPTGHGSATFDGFTPGNDARVVTNLRRENAVIAGKTATAEFAVHTAGATTNPYDAARSVGTSSGGSAVAVATGMVPVALASQTGGSTIRPASYCGVFGFKPSYGVLPRTAMLKTTDTLDTVGMVARSVPDLTLLFEVMRVRGPNYPIVDAALNDPARQSIGQRPWRVGVLHGPKSHHESAAARDGIRQLVERLAMAGCHVEDYSLPPDFDRAHDIHETIYNKSVSYYFRMEWGRAREKFSPRLNQMVEAGRQITPGTYVTALAEQSRLTQLLDDSLEPFDVVLCPSTADEAPIGRDTPDLPDHCLIFTMCRAPSISLPLLRGTTGLPLGAQIVSRRFNDYILLAFADFAASVGV